MTTTKSGPKPIIVGIIILAVIFLIGLFTVLTISISTPVEMADDYHMGYKDLEKKYDNIINKQELFDGKYNANVQSGPNFAMNENSVSIKVSDKTGKDIDNADVTAYVTRPDTTKFNVNLAKFKYENGQYTSPTFNLNKEGRWIVCVKVQIGDAMKYVNFEKWAKAKI